MKWFCSLLVSFIVLISLELCNSFRTKIKSKSKARNKSRGKLREKAKVFNNKKNGPLSWNIVEDETLETLLMQERNAKINNLKPSFISNPFQNKINSNYPYSSTSSLNHNMNTNFISKNELVSENQKSKTFKSVGPYEDSTVNKIGVKYSRMYNNHPNKNLKSGFYGGSRLTRF